MTIRAPSVGKIIGLMVTVGDTVAAGQEVAVIESMKVEIPITAEQGGTVVEVTVAVGTTLRAGDPILTLRV